MGAPPYCRCEALAPPVPPPPPPPGGAPPRHLRVLVADGLAEARSVRLRGSQLRLRGGMMHIRIYGTRQAGRKFSRQAGAGHIRYIHAQRSGRGQRGASHAHTCTPMHTRTGVQPSPSPPPHCPATPHCTLAHAGGCVRPCAHARAHPHTRAHLRGAHLRLYLRPEAGVGLVAAQHLLLVRTTHTCGTCMYMVHAATAMRLSTHRWWVGTFGHQFGMPEDKAWQDQLQLQTHHGWVVSHCSLNSHDAAGGWCARRARRPSMHA